MKIMIIGGGIVGLATAYQLQKKYPSFHIIIIEKENEVAIHQTGNNSGVVHSGVYYKPGSLKAINCVQGKKKLLDFCNEEGIAYELCPKVLVASRQEELPTLQELKKRGDANGVKVEEISKEMLQEIEPHASGIAALHVPECHIIDYSKVALGIAQAFERNGGEVRRGEKVKYLHYSFPRWIVETDAGTYSPDFVINCAGLHCDRIAKMAFPEKDLPCKILPFRGEYYLLKKEKRDLVQGLIYPVPNPKLPF